LTNPDEILSGLRGRVFELPDTKFLEIVHLLERVGDHPRVRETMGAMRPRLVHLRPPRRLNLRRIFCDPFEDLLDSPSSVSLPIKRLDRSIIEPLWRIVEERMGDAALEPLRRQAGKLSDENTDARHTLGCRLWLPAVMVMRTAALEIEGDPKGAAARAAGALPDAAVRLREIADFLDVGHQIAEVKALLSPKPAEFGPEEAEGLVRLIQEAARVSPARVLNLLLVAGSRLRRPADMVAALGEMDFGSARREKPQVFAALSGMIVDTLEAGGSRSEARDLSPGRATELAERLLDGLTSTRDLMDAVSEHQYDRRLETVRASVRELVRTKVIDRVPGEILAGLPLAPDVPGRSVLLDEAKWEATEENAVALRRCRDLAPGLDLASRMTETLTSLRGSLGDRVSALTEAMIERGDEAAESGVALGLRLMEIIDGPGGGGEARERALAALLGDWDAEA